VLVSRKIGTVSVRTCFARAMRTICSATTKSLLATGSAPALVPTRSVRSWPAAFIVRIALSPMNVTVPSCAGAASGAALGSRTVNRAALTPCAGVSVKSSSIDGWPVRLTVASVRAAVRCSRSTTSVSLPRVMT
jgi:hypothetical protein